MCLISLSRIYHNLNVLFRFLLTSKFSNQISFILNFELFQPTSDILRYASKFTYKSRMYTICTYFNIYIHTYVCVQIQTITQCEASTISLRYVEAITQIHNHIHKQCNTICTDLRAQNVKPNNKIVNKMKK